MAQKKITDLTARSDFDATCNLPVHDAVQTYRVTGAQILTYIKAATAPLTTLGDLLYAGASGVATRLAGNTAAVDKMLIQTGTGAVSAAPSWREIKTPTIQKFLTGSGNYTTPADVRWIRVRMVGGGGGGSGSGSGAGAGGTGGTTTFGAQLSAVGGTGGTKGSNGGAGGTASLGTGPIGIALPGGTGDGGGPGNVTFGNGGGGAASPFGGGGGGGTAGAAGQAAPTNSGAGGGGAGMGNASNESGTGGSAGGFIDAIIVPTAAQVLAYAVGAAGTAGTAGTTGTAGGAGGLGVIIVEEHYQ